MAARMIELHPVDVFSETFQAYRKVERVVQFEMSFTAFYFSDPGSSQGLCTHLYIFLVSLN